MHREPTAVCPQDGLSGGWPKSRPASPRDDPQERWKVNPEIRNRGNVGSGKEPSTFQKYQQLRIAEASSIAKSGQRKCWKGRQGSGGEVPPPLAFVL